MMVKNPVKSDKNCISEEYKCFSDNLFWLKKCNSKNKNIIKNYILAPDVRLIK